VITEAIGHAWITDLDELRLAGLTGAAAFCGGDFSDFHYGWDGDGTAVLAWPGRSG
jgi:hypothetical protein